MRRLLLILLAATLVSTPLVASDPGLPAFEGLTEACGSSDNEQPCRKARIIYDTQVGAGQTKTYTGEYVAVGTVEVGPGGTVVFDQAHVSFQDTSAGVLVHPGGTLEVLASTFDEDLSTGSAYRVVAEPASTLRFVDSALWGGEGMRVATDLAEVGTSLFTGIPLALHLDHVGITVASNRFVSNVVAVNQTGGTPALVNNRFEDAEHCVRDWRTNPHIANNSFVDCHVGIWHEQSESSIVDNTLDDRSFPPGGGIVILDTESPVVERNVIRDFGVGILVVNARGFLRDNVVENSVGDGIRVERNSLPMYIDRNVVRGNGGDGIHLDRVHDVPVTGNLVEGNVGHGILVEGSPLQVVKDNLVRANGGDGIRVDAGSTGATLRGNVADGNGGNGLVLAGDGARLAGGSASDNAGNGIVLASALDLTVEDLAALRNGADGVRVDRSQASLARVNASHNGANGFRYDPKGPWDLLGTTDLDHVRAFGNADSGLLNVLGNATFSRNAWWEGNAVAGVRNDDVASIVDVRESYWGHPSGPRHVLNPFGQGDTVVGSVLYAPFLTAPPQ